jgi:S1-C subfamily serine protease
MATNYHDYPQGYPPRPQSSAASFVWPLLFLAALIGLVVWWFWPHQHSEYDANAKPRAVEARGTLAGEEQTTIKIYKEASPAVVHINTAVRRRVLSLNVQEVPRGTGSGVVWDNEGHIVTNFHVVQDANAWKVFLSNDPRGHDARVVGAYPDKDMAVLWIDVPKDRLRPIPIGTSHDLQVGQDAFAIGNPFGLDHTLTKGIISALGREIESVNHRQIKNVIQTDASINPGNSGGPLLDSAGRLIGLNTAIYSPSGVNTGIGFAIPVDEINRVVPQLIAHGKIVRPGLGIVPAPDQVMRRVGQEVGLEIQGVLILSVRPNSPAASAGLRETRQDEDGEIHLGDIIVAIDGKPVHSTEDLYAALDSYKVGDTITLTIVRNGDQQDVKVTLGPVG